METKSGFYQEKLFRAKAVILVIAALALVLSDGYYLFGDRFRGMVAGAVEPLQTVAGFPLQLFETVRDYSVRQVQLRHDLDAIKTENQSLLIRLWNLRQVERENRHLRALLHLREQWPLQVHLGEIIHETRDPFVRRVVVNRGQSHEIEEGSAVVDAQGLVGQVTRVLPTTSEVTLLVDKNQSVPVKIVRNGLRAIAFGMGDGAAMELRYLAPGVDVKVGDEVVTSGLDDSYMANLPVAKVYTVDRDPSLPFARIKIRPVGGVSHGTHVAILDRAAP